MLDIGVGHKNFRENEEYGTYNFKYELVYGCNFFHPLYQYFSSLTKGIINPHYPLEFIYLYPRVPSFFACLTVILLLSFSCSLNLLGIFQK